MVQEDTCSTTEAIDCERNESDRTQPRISAGTTLLAHGTLVLQAQTSSSWARRRRTRKCLIKLPGLAQYNEEQNISRTLSISNIQFMGSAQA